MAAGAGEAVWGELPATSGPETSQADSATGGNAAFSDTAALAKGVLRGDRVLLGRAVTLVESDTPEHRARARELLATLLPRTGRSIRVGITGAPGAGKSTFIEALGLRLVERGRRVAVLAVDPSSALSGGSLLGDKTRMERLARHEHAFIRPSPTGGTLGGVARKTREAIFLFEAAGYEVVLVETVGVGQSETAARALTDCFLLLLAPGLGDGLQGMKRGVVELADLVVVNKADGVLEAAAERTRAEYAEALRCFQPATEGWRTEVLCASAIEGKGIEEVWERIERFREVTRASGAFERRRREQARDGLYQEVRDRLEEAFFRHAAVAALLPEVEAAVMEGALSPGEGALRIFSAFEEAREGAGRKGEGHPKPRSSARRRKQRGKE